MPKGILDTAKGFLGSRKGIDGLDFRRSIFLFISRSGSLKLNKFAKKALKGNRQREAILYSELTPEISTSEDVQVLLGSILDHIDHFIPFLPLDSLSVTKCIKAEGKKICPNCSNLHAITVNILKDLIDWPTVDKKFSSTGCKYVAKSVKEQLLL